MSQKQKLFTTCSTGCSHTECPCGGGCDHRCDSVAWCRLHRLHIYLSPGILTFYTSISKALRNPTVAILRSNGYKIHLFRTACFFCFVFIECLNILDLTSVPWNTLRNAVRDQGFPTVSVQTSCSRIRLHGNHIRENQNKGRSTKLPPETTDSSFGVLFLHSSLTLVLKNTSFNVAVII